MKAITEPELHTITAAFASSCIYHEKILAIGDSL